jgi:hypothetical protein
LVVLLTSTPFESHPIRVESAAMLAGGSSSAGASGCALPFFNFDGLGACVGDCEPDAQNEPAVQCPVGAASVGVAVAQYQPGVHGIAAPLPSGHSAIRSPASRSRARSRANASQCASAQWPIVIGCAPTTTLPPQLAPARRPRARERW